MLFQCLCIFLGIITSSMYADVADLVIFSYNRPLQLYALLESIEEHFGGIGQTAVVYRSDNADFDAGYSIVQNQFSNVTYFKQGTRPREDFKPLTLQATFGGASKYIVFAVDDIIVKDKADLSKCIDLMEQHHAYGFYLRMGDHLNFCYTMNQAQPVPPLIILEDNLRAWKFATGECDWGYPHTVDMTIFRKADIEPAFRMMHYTSPNTLEGNWANLAGPIMQAHGLCFKNSKIVNLPLNRVQQDNNNIAMSISPEFLLEQFLRGNKMDTAPLFQVRNLSAHMNYEPTFIER